jgi:hypothetical protein
MPWLSSLSKGTCAVYREGVWGQVWLPSTTYPAHTHSPTLRMKQNSELRRLESVLIWMHLEKGVSKE